jgi:hypothetical protein
MAMSIQIVMQSAQATGALPEAVLAIEHREAKTPGEPTKKFVVPVLRFADSLGSFMDQASARSLPGGADGGEGEGTVQSLPEPLPTEPVVIDVPEVGIKVTLDDVVEEAKKEGRDEAAWENLLMLLEEDESEGTMQIVEARVRKLFRMMNTVNLWPDYDRSIHAALAKKHGVEHVSDLRKAELNEFATEAFEAARKRVTDAEG